MRLLDELLPRYDVHEVHEARVAASPAAAWEAVREVTAREVRLLVPLMSLRLAPALALRRRDLSLGLRAPVLDATRDEGFVALGERPGRELALGVAGRFWRLAGDGIRELRDVADFAAYDEPGSARAAIDFQVLRTAGGARVRTETRIVGTDAAGTRAFRRYWRAIGVGSAVIRISWLNAIRRRAERA